MKRNRKIFKKGVRWYAYPVAGFLLAGMLLQAGCAGRTLQYTAIDTAMGTVVKQSIYTDGEDVTGEVAALITALERETLSWRIEGSELATVNAAAGAGRAVPLSEKLQHDFEILMDVSRQSNGAFDCTLGPVIRLWNIDAWAAGVGENTGGENRATEPADGRPTEYNGEQSDAVMQLPAPEEIEEALHNTGYKRVEINDGDISLPAGMGLDLGAVGKGIACDRILDYLEGEEVSAAVISVGGSVLTYGKKPDGTPWQVGIVNPEDTDKMMGRLILEGQWCVSTSGDYERYVEIDGIRYHHIFDPATGYPADSGIKSVTILCKSGILSDALSTACFVLGWEKGMELAESYGAEALFVDRQGTVYMTDGMKQYYKETGEK